MMVSWFTKETLEQYNTDKQKYLRVIIPEAGHMVMMDNPAGLNDSIENFFKQESYENTR